MLMITNVRMFFLALLSMLALGATASASASASYEYIVESEGVAKSTSVEGTSGLSLLESKIGTTNVKIECTQDTLTGQLELSGKGITTLLLKKCTVAKPAACSVSETIEGKLKDKLVGTSNPEELFESASGENITKIQINGVTCSVKGTYALTGTQNCELPKALEELTQHEIVCKKAGSSLKLGTEAASFSSTEKVKLVSGKKWAVQAELITWVGGNRLYGEVELGKTKKETFTFETQEAFLTFEDARITTLRGVKSFSIVKANDTCSERGFPFVGTRCTIEVEFQAVEKRECEKGEPCQAILEIPYERPNRQKRIKNLLIEGEVI